MTPLARVPRLYTEARLEAGAGVGLSRDQAHYVTNVMRLKPGDALRLFNGRDGEWLCTMTGAEKRNRQAVCRERLGEPRLPPDIDYLFAPLKHARLDYLAQKATEMGVRRLRPVLTERTAAQRVNLDRMRANAIEAAEQCGLTAVPEVLPPARLTQVLADWDGSRRLVFCDEAAATADPIAALRSVPPGRLALLIGPEGGFAETERESLLTLPFVTALSLGPRLLRADTAAVAALALLQAVCGDWSGHQRD